MGWFSSDDYQNDNDAYSNHPEPHKAHLSHELLGGALAYEATKAYEDHCAQNGHPDSHAKAKEVMAGILGGLVDRFAETKGLDAWDAHQRKKALENAQSRLGVSETFNESITVTDQYDQC